MTLTDRDTAQKCTSSSSPAPSPPYGHCSKRARTNIEAPKATIPMTMLPTSCSPIVRKSIQTFRYCRPRGSTTGEAVTKMFWRRTPKESRRRWISRSRLRPGPKRVKSGSDGRRNILGIGAHGRTKESELCILLVGPVPSRRGLGDRYLDCRGKGCRRLQGPVVVALYQV